MGTGESASKEPGGALPASPSASGLDFGRFVSVLLSVFVTASIDDGDRTFVPNGEITVTP